MPNMRSLGSIKIMCCQKRQHPNKTDVLSGLVLQLHIFNFYASAGFPDTIHCKIKRKATVSINCSALQNVIRLRKTRLLISQ